MCEFHRMSHPPSTDLRSKQFRLVRYFAAMVESKVPAMEPRLLKLLVGSVRKMRVPAGYAAFAYGHIEKY